ncbi:hypothetical protein RUM4293_04334 [Ruegeria atlantica]|uniref:Uncharacterized protein n=1 Tax=Ruegeria atlantica TaxID=81569 RepID=A0A0N7LPJ8_9RHOB|nr:hypothetical protein RUM4293_04334 [Ruegeria atlantica]
MKTIYLQTRTIRRKHGLSEAAARLVATLHFGEGR